jgi:antitoxin ParD1/3/4
MSGFDKVGSSSKLQHRFASDGHPVLCASSMDVTLPPELERLVHIKVESGEYSSTSEVIHHGLRLLQERDVVREFRLAELRKEIQNGVDQLERGEAISFSIDELPQFFDSIKKRGRARMRAKKSRD